MNSDVVKIDQLTFVKHIDKSDIASKVNQLGQRLNKDLNEKNPLFLVVLNGAFIFASDLLRDISIDCDIAFVDAKSYDGMKSSESVKIDIHGFPQVKDRNIVIVEDIVDTGHTVNVLNQICLGAGASEVKVVSFLAKPQAHKYDITVDYVCYNIPKEFVIGYGLDYNGKGRNLPHIYQIRPIDL